MMRNPFFYSVLIGHDSADQYFFSKTGLLSQIEKWYLDSLLNLIFFSKE